MKSGTNETYVNLFGSTAEKMTQPSKKQRSRKYYEELFNKYDRDNSGTIDVRELTAMLQAENEVSQKVIGKLFDYADRNGDRRLDVNEFVNMVSDRRFHQYFRRYVKSYVDLLVPKDKRYRFKPVGRRVGATTEDDGLYEEGMSCWPPPLCMLLISLFQLLCFVLNMSLPNDDLGIIANLFVYDPEKRHECWRFLTYMFVHISWMHLIVNLLTQILLGIALELRNSWYRVGAVYIAGVAAGSLLTSITDPRVYLAGGSGGVYAIITAHLANIIINWNEMFFATVQLFVFIIVMSADVGTALYNRYVLVDTTPIGYSAHIGGALAGFLVGIWILKNVEPTNKEKYLWWVAFIVFILLMGTGIVLNIAWIGHFPSTKY